MHFIGTPPGWFLYINESLDKFSGNRKIWRGVPIFFSSEKNVINLKNSFKQNWHINNEHFFMIIFQNYYGKICSGLSLIFYVLFIKSIHLHV